MVDVRNQHGFNCAAHAARIHQNSIDHNLKAQTIKFISEALDVLVVSEKPAKKRRFELM